MKSVMTAVTAAEHVRCFDAVDAADGIGHRMRRGGRRQRRCIGVHDSHRARTRVWRRIDPTRWGRILNAVANSLRQHGERLARFESIDAGKRRYHRRGEVLTVL